MQDIDGDGWDDVHLIYHGMIWYGSVNLMTEITRVSFDVAASTEPDSPEGFHSGRNYGTHRAFVADTGDHNTLIVGGAPLGTFSDYNCNVSRFVAMLEQSGTDTSSRHLSWSHYFGFGSTFFSSLEAIYTSDPSAAIGRHADVMHGCIHRFSDSRTTMDGEPVVMVNYFDQDAPYDVCLEEQWDLYQDPAWTDEKAETWYACFAENVASMGVWGMKVFREVDGTVLTGGQHHYVWGWTDRLLPSGEVIYLVELLPDSGRFDLDDRSATALEVYALIDGLWSSRGRFPVEGRPSLKSLSPTDDLGVGSFTTVSELTLADSDSDGLVEVQLVDGSWVAWSELAGGFTVH